MRQSTTTSSIQNFQILTLPNSSLNTQQNISNSSQNNNTKITQLPETVTADTTDPSTNNDMNTQQNISNIQNIKLINLVLSLFTSNIQNVSNIQAINPSQISMNSLPILENKTVSAWINKATAATDNHGSIQPETFDEKRYTDNPHDGSGAFYLLTTNQRLFAGGLDVTENITDAQETIKQDIICTNYHVDIKIKSRQFTFVNVLIFYGILMYYIRTCINSTIINLWYFNVLHQDLHHTNITSNIVSSRPLSRHACK